MHPVLVLCLSSVISQHLRNSLCFQKEPWLYISKLCEVSYGQMTYEGTSRVFESSSFWPALGWELQPCSYLEQLQSTKNTGTLVFIKMQELGQLYLLTCCFWMVSDVAWENCFCMNVVSILYFTALWSLLIKSVSQGTGHTPFFIGCWFCGLL